MVTHVFISKESYPQFFLYYMIKLLIHYTHPINAPISRDWCISISVAMTSTRIMHWWDSYKVSSSNFHYNYNEDQRRHIKGLTVKYGLSLIIDPCLPTIT